MGGRDLSGRRGQGGGRVVVQRRTRGQGAPALIGRRGFHGCVRLVLRRVCALPTALLLQCTCAPLLRGRTISTVSISVPFSLFDRPSSI